MVKIEIILKKNEGVFLLINSKESGNREYSELIKIDSDKEGEKINGREIDKQEDADNYLNSEKEPIFYFKKKGVMCNVYRAQIEDIKVYSE
jgi:hypothetical protein